MASTFVALTREELFDRVWSKPVREVAADLGISDVGLAKACRRSGIPLPPQGYWIRRGGRNRAAAKPRLPAPKAGQQTRFEFRPRPPEPTPEGPAERDVLRARLEALEGQLEASSAAVERFVRAARRTVSKQVDERGIMVGSGKQPWPLRTSRALAERAAGVLSAVLARLHALGYPIRSPQDRPDMAAFVIHGQDYWLWLEENSLRSDYVPTAKDLAERKRAGREPRLYFPPKRWIFTPSGRLHLKLGSVDWNYARQQWGERGSKKLEERLDDIVIDMVLFAAEEKREAEQRAKEEAEAEAHRKRARERLQRLAHERLKRLALLRAVKNWRRAEELQRYISAVETAPLATLSNFATELARQRWIAWATKIAADISPILSGAVGHAVQLPPLPEM